MTVTSAAGIDDATPAGSDASPSRAGYVFGPRETRGLLLGLRGPQLAAVLVGLAALVGGLNRGSVGALAGLAILVGAMVTAFAPVGGRTVLDWAPIALGHVTQIADGQTRYRRPLATHAELPGPLSALRINAVPVPGQPDGTTIGVVEDRRRGTLAVVAAVTGTDDLTLLDPDELARRVSGWGGLLAALARDGSAVRRVQWVARTVPDPGGDLARFWAQATAAGRPGLPAAAASYRQLLDGARFGRRSAEGAQSGLWRHEVYVAVAVDARRPRRSVGADRYRVLLREVAAVQALLSQADLEVAGWLPPRALAGVLREAYEPAAARTLHAREPADGEPGVDQGGCGPMATANTWTCFRSDDAWHATYWISEWPRTPVGGDFLTPLLTSACASGIRRTVSVVAEPIDPRAAARATASARTADAANQALRDRVGQLTTERTRTEAANVARRERELVAGHGEYRFLGLITVTAPTSDELETACRQAEQDAHTAGLDLRRLYGEQDQGFAATLPLARGLR